MGRAETAHSLFPRCSDGSGVEIGFIAHNEVVAGSNPAAGRKFRVAQSGRAPSDFACSLLLSLELPMVGSRSRDLEAAGLGLRARINKRPRPRHRLVTSSLVAMVSDPSLQPMGRPEPKLRSGVASVGGSAPRNRTFPTDDVIFVVA